MDKQIKTILQNQQTHTRVKHASSVELTKICKDHCVQNIFYTERILPEFKKYIWKNRIRKITETARIALFAIFIMLFVIYRVFSLTKTSTPADKYPHGTAYATTSPCGQAELAIEAGNFEEAKQILDDAISNNPDNWPLYIPYSELYVAMGENDEAVLILTDAIYNLFHVQNMISPQNDLYEALKHIPPESLTTSSEKRQSCLSDCDECIEKYQTLYRLIKQKSFYDALLLCNELKAAGAYDNYLYYQYYQCYIGLKAYNECEAYLRSLYGKQTSAIDWRYPSDSEINYLLNKIYPLACRNICITKPAGAS